MKESQSSLVPSVSLAMPNNRIPIFFHLARYMLSSFGTISLQWLQVGSQMVSKTYGASTEYRLTFFPDVSGRLISAAGFPIMFDIRLYALSLIIFFPLSVSQGYDFCAKYCSNK